jgi:Secretion system C-terminal sorting domain
MKKMMMLLVTFYAFTTLYGQGFAPIGTKWAYNRSGLGAGSPPATVYLEAVKDTIIKGRICRKLAIKTHSIWCDGRTGICDTDSSGKYKIYVYNSGFRLIHERNDSLFEVDTHQDNNFFLLFHYKLQIGDTLTTKKRKYTIVGKGDTLIGGQILKKWNVNTVCDQPSPYKIIIGRGVFVEKIGTFSDISLNNIYCNTLPSLTDASDYSLCQFSSGNIHIEKRCGYTKAHDLPANILLSIYPNPATVSLSIATEHPFVSYKIYDINGKILQKNTFSDGASIDVSALDNGIYFLWLIDKDQLSAYRRFVLQNK